MNSPENNEKELQRRETELRERENSIRLREIEAEIDRRDRAKATEAEMIRSQPPKQSKIKPKGWGRKLIKFAKFSGFVIFIIILVRIGVWLATIATIAAIAWVGYKLFLEEDKKKKK